MKHKRICWLIILFLFNFNLLNYSLKYFQLPENEFFLRRVRDSEEEKISWILELFLQKLRAGAARLGTPSVGPFNNDLEGNRVYRAFRTHGDYICSGFFISANIRVHHPRLWET